MFIEASPLQYSAYDSQLLGNAIARPVEVARVGKNTHVCNFCGRGFWKRADLDGHKAARHNDGTLYNCHLCTRTFAYKSTLTWHLRNGHEQKWLLAFVKTLCDRTFAIVCKNRPIFSGLMVAPLCICSGVILSRGPHPWPAMTVGLPFPKRPKVRPGTVSSVTRSFERRPSSRNTVVFTRVDGDTRVNIVEKVSWKCRDMRGISLLTQIERSITVHYAIRTSATGRVSWDTSNKITRKDSLELVSSNNVVCKKKKKKCTWIMRLSIDNQCDL